MSKSIFTLRLIGRHIQIQSHHTFDPTLDPYSLRISKTKTRHLASRQLSIHILLIAPSLLVQYQMTEWMSLYSHPSSCGERILGSFLENEVSTRMRIVKIVQFQDLSNCWYPLDTSLVHHRVRIAHPYIAGAAWITGIIAN